MSHKLKPNIIKKNSILGGTLLISGSCIGIGMLALPVVSGLSGFIYSLILLICVGLFMLATAYLLVDLDLADHPNANIITLAEHTLGKWAKISTGIAYLFLFYCLMVAYIAKGGDVLNIILDQAGLSDIFAWSSGSVILAAISFLVIFSGNRAVDLFNRFFVFGLFASFILLIAIGLEEFHVDNLLYYDKTRLLPAIPFLITAFGFHNMIPTISDYLNRDRRKITYSIIFGAIVTFFTYLIWNVTVQAAVPVEGSGGLMEAYKNGLIGTEVLYFVSHNPLVKLLAIYLSFFAIVTSMFGQGLALVDFIFDGIKVKRNHYNRFWILVFIVVPCLLAAKTIANVFFIALGLAGGVAAVYLFCLLPSLMSWSKLQNQNASYKKRAGILLIFSISILIIFYEVYNQTT